MTCKNISTLMSIQIQDVGKWISMGVSQSTIQRLTKIRWIELALMGEEKNDSKEAKILMLGINIFQV